jgi:hypothetical protein
LGRVFWRAIDKFYFAAFTRLTMSAFTDLSYKELQTKSKELGLKANGKKDALIKAIVAATAAADAENAPSQNMPAEESVAAKVEVVVEAEKEAVVLSNGAQTPPAPPTASETEVPVAEAVVEQVEEKTTMETAVEQEEEEQEEEEVVEMEQDTAAAAPTVPEPTIEQVADQLASEEFDTAAVAETVAEELLCGEGAAAEAALEADLVAAVEAVALSTPEEDAADAARVGELVSQYADLSFTDRGKVHCALTGHDMKACPVTVVEHLAGKARTAVLEQRDCAALMEEYGEQLEERDGCFYVPLTGATLKKVRVAVVDHLTGATFLAAQQAWEAQGPAAGEDLGDSDYESDEDCAGVRKLKGIKTPAGKHKFFESPAGKQTPSGKEQWEKQLGSIAWPEAVDETVKTPSH